MHRFPLTRARTCFAPAKTFLHAILLVAALFAAAAPAYAQPKYWVFFEDKDLTGAPALSTEALNRRADRGIKLDSLDWPVRAVYLKRLSCFASEQPLASRWLNAAVVRLSRRNAVEVAGLPFVRGLRPVGALQASNVEDMASNDQNSAQAKVANASAAQYSAEWYGPTWRHMNALRLTLLHQRGFAGKGLRVAVFDAGFPGVDTAAAFRHLRDRGGIVAARDFVENKPLAYNEADHGLEVLSVLAALEPDKYVGAAWEAEYLLARTERTIDETKMEEDAWLRAMEWADSVGVDIINSSLNYNIFDDKNDNYAYNDLDGDTPLVTRAADLAASRGILVVNSAGNDGAGRWRRIIPPCDGDSVMCVGALNLDGRVAPFSSRGPAADDRIKPDVAAPGVLCPVIEKDGGIGYSQGTSFAAPLVAGLAACLWQTQPNASNMDVFSAIVESADRRERPDNDVGAGMPDALRADSLLQQYCATGKLKVFPNPVSSGEMLRVVLLGSGNYPYTLVVFDAFGVPVFRMQDLSPRQTYEVGIQDWDGGKYRLRAVWRNGSSEASLLYLK